MMDKLVDSQSTGSLMAEINDISSRVHERMETDDTNDSLGEDSTPTWNAKNAKTIPYPVRDALHAAFGINATKAMFTSNMKISGFVHSVQHKHAGNSQIFYSNAHNTAPVPGFIHYIFSLEHDSRRFLAVRRLLPSTVKDPFSLYPLLGVQLYSSTVTDFEVIAADEVDAQFACCPMEWENISNVAVISLSRVSLHAIYFVALL